MSKIRYMLVFCVIVLAVFGWMLRGYLQQKLMGTPAKTEWSNKDFKVIAHRGASAYAPENTLSAIQKALELKADMIEIDVHISADNEVIVFHDATLERTSNGIGAIKGKKWSELQKLDAGSWFSSDFANEPIPSLTQVLDLVNGQAILLIEIKVDEQNEIYEGLTNAILEVIEEKNAYNWCILQAFDSRYLREIAQSELKIEYQKLIVDDFSPLPAFIDTGFKFGYLDKEIGYSAINSYYIFQSKSKVEATQKQGFKVFTYTVNETEEIKKVIAMGVDGIITNYPDRAIQLRDGK